MDVKVLDSLVFQKPNPNKISVFRTSLVTTAVYYNPGEPAPELTETSSEYATLNLTVLTFLAVIIIIITVNLYSAFFVIEPQTR